MDGWHRTASLLWPVVLLCTAVAAPSSAASKPAVKARHGMVSSAEVHASTVGMEILRQGGNAVDAAVAVGFALAVTFPQAGNLGGGGFMVIRMADGRTTTIDYRERAPAKATRSMFLDSAGNFVPARSQQGYLSAGVPGSVAGLLMALEKYGTQSRKGVISPSVRLAERGFRVSERFAADLNAMVRSFGTHPSTRAVFACPSGEWKEGDTLVQRDLGLTLRRVMEQGRDGFYRGRISDMIERQMKQNGGLITAEDLREYEAVERPPVRSTYRGYEIISMGPPSSGGVLLIHLLNLLEPFDMKQKGFNSSETIGLMAEAMKLAFADRAEFLGDPDFYQVPTATLLSKKYADARRALLDTTRAVPSVSISHGTIQNPEAGQTTHYSVVDRQGNAVSVTTTLNSWFGCGVVVDGAGFFLNNEMDDFAAKPGAPNQFGLLGGEANSVQPKKRMLSAMTPTVVLKNGSPWLITGSPGGSTIITTVLQIILNVVDHGMDLQEAVDAPRIHHQWRPDTLWYEHRGLSRDVVVNLEKRGYTVVERPGYQGWVEAIMIDRRHGWYLGASDPRGSGASVGF